MLRFAQPAILCLVSCVIFSSFTMETPIQDANKGSDQSELYKETVNNLARIMNFQTNNPQLNLKELKERLLQNNPLSIEQIIRLYNAAIAVGFPFAAQFAAYAVEAQKLKFNSYELRDSKHNKPHQSMHEEIGRQSYLFHKSPMHDRKYFSVRELADHECKIEKSYSGEYLADNPLSERVNSLDGIARFPNLKELWSHTGKIETIETEHLKGLTQLSKLSLIKHQIHSIPGIAQLTTLTKLDLDGNRLTNAALCLSGLQALTSLDLHSNCLTSLAPLTALTRLQELDVSGNQLAELTQEELISHQQLTYLSAGYNWNPETKKSLRNITGVYLLTNLINLELPRTDVADISPAITNLRALNEILLDETEVDSLQTLVNVSTLTDLHARHAKITQVTPEEIEKLKKMPKLNNLALGGNHIPKDTKAQIKEALPHVQWVNFNHYMHSEQFRDDN